MPTSWDVPNGKSVGVPLRENVLDFKVLGAKKNRKAILNSQGRIVRDADKSTDGDFQVTRWSDRYSPNLMNMHLSGKPLGDITLTISGPGQIIIEFKGCFIGKIQHVPASGGNKSYESITINHEAATVTPASMDIEMWKK